MKKLFLGFLLIGATAEASWFQDYCSNGEGTIKIAQGHNVNETKLTRRVLKNDGSYITKTVTVLEAQVTEVESKELDRKTTTQCNGDWGYVSWYNARFKKVRIEKTDGSLFSADFVGVSADRRSIEANVFCEENGNSEISCQEKPWVWSETQESAIMHVELAKTPAEELGMEMTQPAKSYAEPTESWLKEQVEAHGGPGANGTHGEAAQVLHAGLTNQELLSAV